MREVRVIDLFVDALPLKELGFLENEPAEEGRPMYHPADLFKLYVYGYLNRIRTSRLLERECQRNIELLWLLKGLQPCFRTIAGFRSDNPKLFRNAFTHFVRQINRKGLTGENAGGARFKQVQGGQLQEEKLQPEKDRPATGVHRQQDPILHRGTQRRRSG
ncbi:MAG: transposase [Bacteroidetes bacterium]|nr:transposase [Bacteroidota bacterium]